MRGVKQSQAEQSLHSSKPLRGSLGVWRVRSFCGQGGRVQGKPLGCSFRAQEAFERFRLLWNCCPCSPYSLWRSGARHCTVQLPPAPRPRARPCFAQAREVLALWRGRQDFLATAETGAELECLDQLKKMPIHVACEDTAAHFRTQGSQFVGSL